MNVLRAVYRFFCKAEVIVCCIGFMALIALVFLSAILRFFHFSMSWNIDMAMLLLAWTAFLGADIGYRAGQLVGVDLLTRNLPASIQIVIEITIFTIIFIALCMIVYFGIRLSLVEKLRRFQSIRVPYSIVTMSIVLASASMAVSTVNKIRHCFLRLINPDKGHPESQSA